MALWTASLPYYTCRGENGYLGAVPLRAVLPLLLTYQALA